MKIKDAVLGLCLCWISGQCAPSSQPEENLLDQLLALSAPAPDWRQLPPERLSPVEFQEPIRDADEFLKKWSHTKIASEYQFTSEKKENSELTPDIQGKLLEDCKSYPKYLPKLLGFFNESSATYDTVFSIFQQADMLEIYTSRETQEIKQWLIARSIYFRDDLIQSAKSFHFDGEYIQNKNALNILSRLDWATAKPILISHSQSVEPHVFTYALSLLYRYAEPDEKDRLREQLQRIVNDDSAPGSARATACDAVLKSAFDGKPEWFISTLETLPSLSEGYMGFSPLEQCVASDPDKWIPLVIEQIKSSNRNTHDNAVQCLVQFHLERAREDALRPLLPWLGNPEWSSARDRLRLIQSLDLIKIPESISGLMWVVDHENGSYLSGAAEALEFQDAKIAIPTLKASLVRAEKHHKREIIRAIQNLGGFSEDDILTAIKALAEHLIATTEQKELQEYWWNHLLSVDLSPMESLGLYMVAPNQASDSLARLLLERAERVEPENPDIANIFRQIVRSWSVPESGGVILAEISKSDPSLEAVIKALNNRDKLREWFPKQVKNLATGDGVTAAIASVIIGNEECLLNILNGNDAMSQAMLLACSRFSGQKLSVPQVALLFDKGNETLNNAAEQYLVENNSQSARAVILSQHPDEIRIFGARGLDQFAGVEQSLRPQLLEANSPDEIFALLSGGGWGGNGQIIVSVRNDTARLTLLYGNGRYAERDLTSDELSRLRYTLDVNHIEDLPPLYTRVLDGIEYEYIHLTPNGGRRVYMNNPLSEIEDAPIYYYIVELFQNLRNAGKLTVHYNCEKEIDGLTVILSAPEYNVNAVWSEDDDTRVLLADETRSLQWYRLLDGKVGEKVEQPEACRIIGSRDDIPKYLKVSSGLTLHPWQSGMGNGEVVRAGRINRNDEGLWRCSKGKEPVKLCNGRYARPVTTPDGKWVVAAKADKNWAPPNDVIRYDLQNNKEYVLGIPAAENFEPISYLPTQKRILLFRSGKLRGEETSIEPEYRLLDSESGESEIVNGDFEPLDQLTYRPLQASCKKGFKWAAIRDRTCQGTALGLYDMQEFVFDPVMLVPFLNFNSMDMWIDEENEIVYLTINDDLVRFPLTKRSE